MRFADIVTDVLTSSALGTTNTPLVNLVKRGIREGLTRYAAAYSWPHYRVRGTLTTIDDYSDGTVAVTNGLTTVTGTTTVWTSAMAGRKIRFANQRAWYTIASVGGVGTLTLDQAFQGDTDTGLTYTIFQDEYRLNADVFQMLNMRQNQNGLLMVGLSYHDLDTLVPSPVSLTDPFYWGYIGRWDDRYSTGTLTGTAASTTLTGTGTAWTSVLGLGKGSRIAVIGSNEVYTVKSVDSDTQLTVYEPIGTAPSATASYLIYLNNIRLQVTDIPNAARHLYYRYHRIPYPLVNDYDEPDMPREHHALLIWAGLTVAQASKGNLAMSQDAEQRFIASINDQIREYSSTSPTEAFLKRSMDISIGSPLAIRYPSQYGFPVWVPSP